MRRPLAVALAAALNWNAPAPAAALPTVASINACTDQLVMALADPAQIVGLSPYARDPVQSWDAIKAANFPKLSGTAEDVLVLKPDVVVAGRFTKRATRELLKDKGLRVAEFDVAQDFEAAKNQIRRMGALLGQTARATSEMARLDTAIAQARAAAVAHPVRVLALSRRGWVAGRDGVTASLLATAGLGNAANDIGLNSGGFASLEQIVALRPDYLLVSDGSGFADDEGSAFLLHPALEKLYPPSKRIVIPERLTVCGGPMLAEAMQRLTSEIARVVR